MGKLKKVFIVDDDPVNNMICRLLIEKYAWAEQVVIFEDARKALQVLETEAQQKNHWPEIILLDLEFPTYDGWDFLTSYQKLPENYRSKSLLYMLSSSISPLDIRRAGTYPQVKAYFSKPLTPSSLNQIKQDYDDHVGAAGESQLLVNP